MLQTRERIREEQKGVVAYTSVWDVVDAWKNEFDTKETVSNMGAETSAQPPGTGTSNSEWVNNASSSLGEYLLSSMFYFDTT